MFCPQCGTSMADGDAFCPMCGADVRQAVAAPAAYAPQPPQPAAATPTAASTPYTKAPLGARLLALIADGVIAAALLPLGLLLVNAGVAQGNPSIPGFALLGIGGLWQLAYTLGRDGMRGAGFGKRMTGLVVTRVDTGAPASMGASVVRQLVLWALGIVPVIGSLVEPIIVISNEDGRRLGDKAAKTQVARASEVAARGHVVAGGKGLAIVAVIVALLVGIAGSAIGGVIFARTVTTVANGTDMSITTPEPPASTELIEQAATDTPEGVIDSFYAAVSSGDLDAVKATMSQELAYYAEPGMFEGWTNPDYRVVGSSDQGNDIYNVDVQEYDGDYPTYTLTYILIKEDGAWKIDDWITADEISDTGTDESAAGSIGPEEVVDAVGNMLNYMKMGDVGAMKSYATQGFQSSDPSFFYSAEGALIQFEVAEVFPDAAQWVVIVDEQWNSGPERVTYFVTEVDGRALVDGVAFE